jgi:hypothetical protein
VGEVIALSLRGDVGTPLRHGVWRGAIVDGSNLGGNKQTNNKTTTLNWGGELCVGGEQRRGDSSRCIWDAHDAADASWTGSFAVAFTMKPLLYVPSERAMSESSYRRSPRGLGDFVAIGVCQSRSHCPARLRRPVSRSQRHCGWVIIIKYCIRYRQFCCKKSTKRSAYGCLGCPCLFVVPCPSTQIHFPFVDGTHRQLH